MGRSDGRRALPRHSGFINPAQNGAELFRAELASGTHVASKITFPVPRGRFDENLEVFQHAFATFPEKNEVPYQSRAELAAKRASQHAAEEEGSEDEDDWHKYL